MFLKDVFNAHKGCIYLIKNAAKRVILWNIIKSFSIWIYFKIEFIPVMQSWIFSIITPVFSVTWSFRKSFEYADLLLKKHFWLLSVLKTVVLLHILVGAVIFFCRILWWIESSKEQHLFEIEIVFTVTFDQFNASFLKHLFYSVYSA